MINKPKYFVMIICVLMFSSLVLVNDLVAKEKQQGLEKFAFTIFQPSIPGLRADGAVTEINLRKRFGQPKNVKTWELPDNREPGQTNRFKQLEYDGLAITIVAPLPSSETWINNIIVTTSKYELIGGLRVGKPISQFIHLLGEPNYKNTTYIAETYETKGRVILAGHATIILNVDSNGIVTQISWEYWAD